MREQILYLVLIMFVVVAFMVWWRTQEIKHYALKVARRHCDELSLQMLDESIALKRIRLRRSERGAFNLVREFVFEFSSTGDERYIGLVEVFGRKVERVTVQPHRI